MTSFNLRLPRRDATRNTPKTTRKLHASPVAGLTTGPAMSDAEWARWRMRGHGKDPLRGAGGGDQFRIGDTVTVPDSDLFKRGTVVGLGKRECDRFVPDDAVWCKWDGNAGHYSRQPDGALWTPPEELKLISRDAPAEKVGRFEVGARVRVKTSQCNWDIGADCTIVKQWRPHVWMLEDDEHRQAYTHENHLELASGKP